jgi:hypothetical protein
MLLLQGPRYSSEDARCKHLRIAQSTQVLLHPIMMLDRPMLQMRACLRTSRVTPSASKATILVAFLLKMSLIMIAIQSTSDMLCLHVMSPS